MNSINISERMRAIESMVLPGEPMADIGTDHGFIPADLLMRGIVPHAIMTDINPGPLEKCRENMRELGLGASLFELRLGNGLEPLKTGEAATAVIAGMGGELIWKIVCDAAGESSVEGPEDASEEDDHGFVVKRLVLQPRTHSDELRAALTGSGFRIVDYKLSMERGRICEVFAVEPVSAGQYHPDDGLISRFLLEKGDPLLADFIDAKIQRAERVITQLRNSKSTESADAARLWQGILIQLNEIRRDP